MTSRRLKIGLLLDDQFGSKQIRDFVAWAQTQPDVIVSHLILHPGKGAPATGSPFAKLARLIAAQGLSHAFARAVFRMVGGIERKALASRGSALSEYVKSFDLTEIVGESITIHPIVSRSGLSYRFEPADVQRVKDLDLDVLIRCGHAILRGDILRAARFGVLSFHHADNRVNRGLPAAFWETFHRQDVTGFTIQQLTEDLDGGNVLVRGSFPTRQTYVLNHFQLLEKSNYYLKRLVKSIAAADALPPFLPSFPYTDRLYRMPRASQSLRYLAAVGARTAKKMGRRIAGRDFRWSVSYDFVQWRKAVFWRAKRINNPPGHFLADPFVVSRDGKHFCFLEDYDYSRRKGCIAVYELGKKHATRLGVAVEEEFHLSFPFTFEYAGELYMCPESSVNRDIRLYRCIDFPLVWKLEKLVMADVSAADTMFFERDGRWWMLTNIDPANLGENCSELSIFHAKSPLAEEWIPHAGNPVITDPTIGRNAGLLIENGTAFRVAQKQGFGRYGAAASIMQISELTETTYAENLVATINPAFADGLIGTHHLHGNESVTVFDQMTVARIR